MWNLDLFDNVRTRQDPAAGGQKAGTRKHATEVRGLVMIRLAIGEPTKPQTLYCVEAQILRVASWDSPIPARTVLGCVRGTECILLRDDVYLFDVDFL